MKYTKFNWLTHAGIGGTPVHSRVNVLTPTQDGYIKRPATVLAEGFNAITVKYDDTGNYHTLEKGKGRYEAA